MLNAAACNTTPELSGGVLYPTPLQATDTTLPRCIAGQRTAGALLAGVQVEAEQAAAVKYGQQRIIHPHRKLQAQVPQVPH